MAEDERGGIQNVWLLFIALVLGALVVVIYNVHIYNVRREARGRTVRLLRVTRDMQAGEQLTSDDLDVQAVPRQYERSLGDVVGEENLDFATGQVLNRPIEKGRWLLWAHITGTDTRKPANEISKGNVAVAVPLDSKMAPGDILRQNDRVNVVALIPIGANLKTFRIVEGVRILAIGGEGIRPGAVVDNPGRSAKPSRSYRSVTVEISKDVAIEFANILTHVSGRCWVELLSSREEKTPNFGRINPQLKELAKQPSKPVRSVEDEWE